MRDALTVVLASAWVSVAPAAVLAQKPVDLRDPATVMRVTQFGFLPLHKDGKVLVLDVRDAKSFAEGRIPGAINVPYADVERRIEEIREKAAGRTIVAYCSCPAEHTAAEAGLLLHKHGLKDVRVLVGGYPEWVRAGGAVER